MPAKRQRNKKGAKAKSNKPTTKFITTPFVSHDTIEWCAKNNVTLMNGMHCKVGDVVICSDGGHDFAHPCVLGRVTFVCPAGSHQVLVGKNGQPHIDGEMGHVFVNCHKKQKAAKHKDLSGTLNAFT